MMKNLIVFTLFSFLTLGGFVVGFPLLDMAHAAKEKDCSVQPHPKGKTKIKKVDEDFGNDVLAVFVLKADGNIEVMEGPTTNFREPRGSDGKPGKDIDAQPPDSPHSTSIPGEIEHEISGTHRLGEIRTHVGNTCAYVNGVYYCW